MFTIRCLSIIRWVVMVIIRIRCPMGMMRDLKMKRKFRCQGMMRMRCLVMMTIKALTMTKMNKCQITKSNKISIIRMNKVLNMNS